MSTHSVKVVRIEKVGDHPYADRLQITHCDGWQVVIAKDDFVEGDLAVYIEPDYMVPIDRKEFAFLADRAKNKTHYRLKAIKLRKLVSYGMLIHVPEDLEGTVEEGDDVMDRLNIFRYEPPTKFTSAHALAHPDWPVGVEKFDVEALKKFPRVFKDNETVIVTEKIHGANARYHTDKDGTMFVGSRRRWVKDDRANQWSTCFTHEMREFMACHHGWTLYGEIYGPVQSLKYGTPNKAKFIAFAVKDELDEYVDYDKFAFLMTEWSIPLVPQLYRGPYGNLDLDIAEQDSILAKQNHAQQPQIMEGVVIIPEFERSSRGLGRVCLKHISKRYWLKK